MLTEVVRSIIYILESVILIIIKVNFWESKNWIKKVINLNDIFTVIMNDNDFLKKLFIKYHILDNNHLNNILNELNLKKKNKYLDDLNTMIHNIPKKKKRLSL